MATDSKLKISPLLVPMAEAIPVPAPATLQLAGSATAAPTTTNIPRSIQAVIGAMEEYNKAGR